MRYPLTLHGVSMFMWPLETASDVRALAVGLVHWRALWEMLIGIVMIVFMVTETHEYK